MNSSNSDGEGLGEGEPPSDDEPLGRENKGATSKADALGEVRSASAPLTTTPSGDPADAAEPGAGTLNGLLRRHIFFDYFVYVAERKYAGKNVANKVRKLADDHPRIYKLVLLADIIVSTIVVSALIVVSLLGAYKAISPIPWPWLQG